MKKIYALVLTAILFGGTQNLFAETKTDKVKVSGNCGMCESRIEKTALGVAGVTKADWNKETKELVVSFDATKASLDKIEAAVAKAGHDTPKYKTDAKTYDALPGCCHYDRAPAK